MHKIVHADFELDLTNYGTSFVDENYWFSNRFFTKYSFPFPIYLTDELIKIFGYFLDDNNQFLKTTFNVTYYLGNQKESAVFEIISQLGKRLEATVTYGFDELPNFNKKLTELPLQVIAAEVVVNIYTHAKATITQAWPAVNYNFPQIFTDKHDIEDITWSNFEGKINNYFGGNFRQNEINAGLFINRNIIQPLPYLLHVLTQGFLDAGYTLKGAILQNETIKRTLVFVNTDHFVLQNGDFNFKVTNGLYVDGDNANESKSLAFINLVAEKTYTITGNIYLWNNFPDQFTSSVLTYTKIMYQSTVLAEISTNSRNRVSAQVNVTFTTNNNVNQDLQRLVFSSVSHSDYLNQTNILFDLEIKREIRDEASQVKIYDDIDLKRCVSEMTFGELLTEIKNQFNLEYAPDGSDMYVNFVEKEMNYNNAIDLSEKEILKPKKKFNQLNSILLKYRDLDDESFFYDLIFQDKKDILTDSSFINDKTEEIELNILPLPSKTVDQTTTALTIENDAEDKVYFTLYNGLQNSLNTTIINTPLQITTLHPLHHQKWFNFRLNAINYRWVFKMYLEQLAAINKKAFAYGRYHVIKSLDKTQISDDLFEVEIETETLE